LCRYAADEQETPSARAGITPSSWAGDCCAFSPRNASKGNAFFSIVFTKIPRFPRVCVDEERRLHPSLPRQLDTHMYHAVGRHLPNAKSSHSKRAASGATSPGRAQSVWRCRTTNLLWHEFTREHHCTSHDIASFGNTRSENELQSPDHH
jgi:hypothetical protein